MVNLLAWSSFAPALLVWYTVVSAETTWYDTDNTVGGPVRSYVQTNSNGSLDAIGVAFPLELVYNTTLAAVRWGYMGVLRLLMRGLSFSRGDGEALDGSRHHFRHKNLGCV